MKAKLKDIVNFYNYYPEFIGDIEVETRYGYKTIQYADITAYNSDIFSVKTSNGFYLEGAPDHKILCNDYWVKLKNINKEMIVDTKYGKSKVLDINKLDEKEDLYDLQVENVYEYYANNITSHNSTIIDALIYVVYGTTFRTKTKLSDMINNKNNKNLLVELEVINGNTAYKITRGMKPNILKIEKNGIEVKSESSKKIDQEYIRDYIIPFDKSVCENIMIIGKENYTPFMDLSIPKRREFLEVIFEMSHLGSMKAHIQTSISKNEKLIIKTNGDIRNLELEIEYLNKLKQESADNIKNEERDLELELQTYEKNYKAFVYDEAKHKELKLQKSSKSNEKSGIEKNYYIICAKNKQTLNKIDRYKKEDAKEPKCPTCGHAIEKEDLSGKIKELEAQYDKETENKTYQEILELDKTITKLQSEIATMDKVVSDMNYELQNINKVHQKFKKLNTRKEKLKDTVDELNLETVNESLKKKIKEKVVIQERLIYLKYLKDEFLHDNGFKTYLLSQFRPELQKLIEINFGEYSLPNRIEIKSNFEMVIKNLRGKPITYGILSAGQKQRINLSIWGAFTDIIKSRHKIHSNLIFFDEILDSSLDANGKDTFMQILKSKIENQGLTAFIISHSMVNFENRIKVTMKTGLSYYDYS